MPTRFRRRGRSVVVRDAGGGLGREIALGLAARRYIVFGTADSAQEAENLRGASSGRVSLAVCDLRNAEAVNAWAAGISEAIGASGLDILINNSIHPSPGPLELVTLDEVRRGFEVHVFGGLAVINAFLPALRMAHGRIVQISSWAEDRPRHFDGVRAASQAAMEAFSAAWRAELKPFGIDVIVAAISNLEADGSRATAALAQIDLRMTAVQRKLYGERLRVCMEELAGSAARGEPATVAAQVVELSIRRHVAARSSIDRDA
ncbi:SDR family NAD(P)-dependent oxidoreductase [Sphingomonas sp. DT-207]|uniref:SDR family NAD(P)-dependent oxidoreductase n=1 Tax=Sphingomonas sp. DT-207 TaxID=3396167 RepID=UPI003F53FAC8